MANLMSFQRPTDALACSPVLASLPAPGWNLHGVPSSHHLRLHPRGLQGWP